VRDECTTSKVRTLSSILSPGSLLGELDEARSKAMNTVGEAAGIVDDYTYIRLCLHIVLCYTYTVYAHAYKHLCQDHKSIL
jgi:hypothetical protein